jgi:predicted phosphodiesterase
MSGRIAMRIGIISDTHHQDIRREGKTLIVNPGEATDWITGSARVAIVNLDDMSCTTEPLGSEQV